MAQAELEAMKKRETKVRMMSSRSKSQWKGAQEWWARRRPRGSRLQAAETPPDSNDENIIIHG